MAKLNLNIPVKDLEGKEIENTNLGKDLATVLAQSSTDDPLKFMHWATKLFNGEELELDPTDSGRLKEFVKNSNVLTNLWKARILENLN